MRSIEEMVSDGLIEARQKGAHMVRLEKSETGIVTRIADIVLKADERPAVLVARP